MEKKDIALWAVCIGSAAAVACGTVLRPMPAGKNQVPVLCDVAQNRTYAADPRPEELQVSKAAEVTLPEETLRSIEDVLAGLGADRLSLDYSGADAYLLAKIAFCEAGGEDLEGQALVIRVVLNRVESDAFPDTIEEVIYQDGQFEPVRTGLFETAEPSGSCWEALDLVETGWDESQGALYFCTPKESGWHEKHLMRLFQHGGHVFYK